MSKPDCTLVKRDEKGRWLSSGNPTGKRVGVYNLSKYIQEKHGPALADELWKVYKNSKWPPRERLEALKMLIERGYGRNPHIFALAVDVNNIARMVDSFDDKELDDAINVIEAKYQEITDGNKDKAKKLAEIEPQQAVDTQPATD
jgi:hypothetical protein